MDAASGPSRAAALLAGELSGEIANGLTPCYEIIVLQVLVSPKPIRRDRPNRFQEVGGMYYRGVATDRVLSTQSYSACVWRLLEHYLSRYRFRKILSLAVVD